MHNTLFAIQVFLGLPEAQALHGQLRQMIEAAPGALGYANKNGYYKHLVEVVRPWVGRFDRGIWDYIEDPAAAEEEWTGWTQGTVADALEPRENQAPYRGTRENMFLTVLVLLTKGGTSDEFMCERCRMPDQKMFERGAFLYLLEALPMLNFASVRADAIYVRPGLSAGAVREDELGEEHYEYLRALT